MPLFANIAGIHVQVSVSSQEVTGLLSVSAPKSF